MDEEESFNNIMNHRFRVLREASSMDSSVEILEDRRRSEPPQGPQVPMPNGRGFQLKPRNGQPQQKRPRTDSNGSGANREPVGSMANWTGNGGGVEARSRFSAPLSNQRPNRREPTLTMRLEAGRRSVEGGAEPRPGGSRGRNWSPIRSPEDLNRSRPRDRDLREEMGERRGARGGRGRGQMSARGSMRGRQRGMNNNQQEDKDWQDQNQGYQGQRRYPYSRQ